MGILRARSQFELIVAEDARRFSYKNREKAESRFRELSFFSFHEHVSSFELFACPSTLPELQLADGAASVSSDCGSGAASSEASGSSTGGGASSATAFFFAAARGGGALPS